MALTMAQILWDLAQAKADLIDSGQHPGVEPNPDILGRGVILRAWLERFPSHKERDRRGHVKAEDKVRRSLTKLEQVAAIKREGGAVRILDWDILEKVANGELYVVYEDRKPRLVEVNRGYED